MSIHPCGIMAYLLFFDFLDISIFSITEIMKLLSPFLQNLNLTTSCLSSQAFIFIILWELWNYVQFNLFATI